MQSSKHQAGTKLVLKEVHEWDIAHVLAKYEEEHLKGKILPRNQQLCYAS